MRAICSGERRDGMPCTQTVGAGESLCHHHAPGRQDDRRRAASKAGSSKPNRELRRAKDRLLALADDVLAGVVDRGDAAVVAQITNTYLRALEIERRTFDVADLLSRLEALEQRADRLRGA